MTLNITSKQDGTYLEKVESMEECKWRINGMCCNDSSEFLGDCYCEKDLKRNCFKKEDGVIEEV